MVTKKMPPRRQRILSFLQEFYSDNGIPPTVRDIQKACEISSTSVVDYNLEKLREAGYINRRHDVARGIEILDQEGEPISNAPRIQILGLIAAGSPIPVWSAEESAASQEFDTVEVSPELQRQHGKLFALRVAGTSMIDALIDDGDVVIIKPATVRWSSLGSRQKKRQRSKGSTWRAARSGCNRPTAPWTQSIARRKTSRSTARWSR
jgi:repressor LexA